MSIPLKARNAAIRPFYRPSRPSIAQRLANQLNRKVYAWKVGLFFSDNPNQRHSSTVDPVGPTIYFLAEGGTARVQACVFTPGTPEPKWHTYRHSARQACH